MLITSLAVVFVALLHLFFLYIEMFLWDKPFGIKAFSLPSEIARATKSLGANQGLYNGFLAGGLILGLLCNSQIFQIYFLICVTIAGIFGAFTVKKSIFYIQALPAIIALGLTIFS